MAELVELVASEPSFTVQAFTVPAVRKAPGWLFQALENQISRRGTDPDRPVSWPAHLPPLQSGRPADLDVLIWLAAQPEDADCAGWARQGVWTIRPGGLDPPPGLPFWREVRDRLPVTRVALVRHDRSFAEGRVLATHTASTAQGWFYANNKVEPLRAISVLLFEQLLGGAGGGSEVTGVPAPDSRYPGFAETAGFLARRAARSIAVRMKARRQAGWFVALRRNPALFTAHTGRFVPDGFEELAAPPGHGYADPFPLHWQGRDWVLVEEILPGGRGRLAAVSPDSGERATMLERPYHLSYPFPVAVGKDLFLLPESATERTVQLFRCIRFPDQWQLEKELYTGSMLVDTTPFFHDGTWYFFTTRFENGGHTFLFHADRLDGAWRYHPANPISTDVRASRGAGALFRHGNRLLRPVQDGSRRYGYAIALREIVRLTPAEFEERAAGTILPAWRPDLLGTHTLNASAGLEAIDGLRYR